MFPIKMQLRQTFQFYWNVKKQRLKIKFVLAGWIENPIKSVVLTFPIDKIVFPAVTLCPRDSRPDRWGTAIKIFDQLNTDCESKRWDSMFDLKADVIILNSLQRSGREKKMYHKNSSFQIRVFILFDDCQFKTPSPAPVHLFIKYHWIWLYFNC